jgi:acyl-CoA dehydrogenase-like protein
MDTAERGALTASLGTMMATVSGSALDRAMADFGWAELLAELPEVAIPAVFEQLGWTGAHAPLLNDVVLDAAGRTLGGTVPLPYAGGAWVVWDRADDGPSAVLDSDLPLRQVEAGDPVPLAAGRVALGWWLLGTGRAMLDLARAHALERLQFGRPIASFQAVRHRLAETVVALDGAEATLVAAHDDLGALLAKAAAGQAALTAARHCQQVLGGMGFTAEHGLHRHVRRVLVLDGLLGSARELTREAGALLLETRSAPRLVNL